MTPTQKSRSRATQVTIMGSEYVLSGDIDPEYMSQVAQYVNARMKELHDRTVGMSTTRLAVLTAINIADELFTLQSESHMAKKAGGDRVDQLESRITAWLDEVALQRGQCSAGGEV